MADIALDGYMYFVGEGKYGKDRRKSIGQVKGETPDARFGSKNAFQIWYFRWQSSHKNDTDNRLDAKASVGAFDVRKDIDIATPTLFMAHATCAVFEGCHVYFRKAGGGKLFTFYHAAFSDVIIEKWECNLDNGAEEKLTVNFNWCEISYFPQALDGAKKKSDLAAMKQFCTSDPSSQDVPRVLKKGNATEGEMDFASGK